MTGFIILSVGLSVLALALLISVALTLSRLRIELPPNSPEATLAQGQILPRSGRTRPLVVCAGDSLTHGVVSVNWVDMLAGRMPEADFVNAGVNSELAWNLYQRLEPIIKLDPDCVTVLIGTNDANATLGMNRAIGYMATQRLPELPTPQFYRECLTLIVRRLKAETQARIALASLPPIGEDTGHYAWLRSEEYSQIVKDVAKAEDVAYLPLRERLSAYLAGAPRQKAIALEEFLRAGSRAHVDHTLFGKSWDQISAANGFHLLIDGIHLNSHGATIMADLVERFVRESARAGKMDA